jgi:acyl dehydratase
MKKFNQLSELTLLVGHIVASSEWLMVTQEQIQLFAKATGDQQWIHVDPILAAQGPFGGTIAHGFLTLSLLPHFFATSFVIEHSRLRINYGLNRVRFPAPVPVNSRLRAHFKLLEYIKLADDGYQLVWEVTIEREGSNKPVCVAESITRDYL